VRLEALRYLLLAGPKRWRAEVTGALRGTPLWTPLRTVYHRCRPLWRNPVVRARVLAMRRRLYCADPRSYWQQEGGRQYTQDEEFLLGPGSLTEQQGRFLATAIAALGATTILEVGCGYGRMLKELRRHLDARLVGCDFSEPQLKTAREYLAPVTMPLILADATQGLPFADSAFEVVYTQGSLMHVPPPLDRSYRSELARIASRYIIHTEDVQDSDSMFAHDNERHYKELGHRLVEARPYPLNLAGQTMKFEIFELRNDRGR
jgi:SAM-dependent methyltransferase